MSKGCWKLSNGEIMITVQELARQLEVTRQTVYIWVARGMPVLRSDDGKIMVLYREAIEWLREQKRQENIKLEVIPNLEEQLWANKVHKWSICVRNTRLRFGLSQEEFANLLEVSLSTVCSWEQGRCQPDQVYLKIIVGLNERWNCDLDGSFLEFVRKLAQDRVKENLSQSQSSDTSSDFLKGFLVGGAVGGILGILGAIFFDKGKK